MSAVTSLMDDQPVALAAIPAETLYQFDESPLLARQSRQESNARSYPRRIPLALKRPVASTSRTSKAGVSSIAWPVPGPWPWATTTRW